VQIKRKKSLFLIVSIPIVILLTLLTLSEREIGSIKQVGIYKTDIRENLIALDLGISTFHNLTDDDNLQDTKEISLFKKNIIPFIKSFPKIAKYKLFNEHKFDRIDININFSDYLILDKDRKRAIKEKILSNPTEVNAILEHKGEKYKASLRLKGDFPDHWLGTKRQSLRIKIKNDKNILGFSRFSIHKTRSRQHPYDHAFQSMIIDTGNLGVIHKFAHIFVNGVNWGIMDMEEHISKEFLEKQNRKESPVVRFSNEEKWRYEIVSKNPYNNYKLSDASLFLKLYNTKTLKNLHNRKVYSYISKNMLSNNENIYDINSFSKALIMSLVWNNTHPLIDPNSKYYFNPYTLKLEPIATDQGRWFKLQDSTNEIILNDKYSNILLSQHFLKNLPINLEKVRKTISSINKDLSYPQSLFPVDKKKSTKIIENNMKKILNNIEYYLVNPTIIPTTITRKNRPDINSTTLPTKQQASEFKKHLHVKHYTNGNLELYNLLPDNVVVRGIFFNGKAFTDKEIVVPSYLSRSDPTIIETHFKGINDNMFIVKTQYQGFDRTVKNDITLTSDGIKNPLLLNTTHEFDFINKLEGKRYEIKQGNWTVDKPIIVEGDLYMLPGVNLQFSKDSYLIIKGSLTALGSKERPIVLKSVSDSWKGIYVLNAVNKSQLKNVKISHIAALEDELLKLTGGITFYKADVDFENVGISNVKAEDAINIVESSFSLNSVIINNTFSDGLDSDFSKGKIFYSEFSNIGGDALDFSGSYASIDKTKVTNVKDKAVSSGENSTLTVENSNFKNIGVGVASKDGSSVTMSNSVISDYRLYAAMSYIKKDFYTSMTNIHINNSSIAGKNSYIRQKGTNMSVDGIDIPESEISVKKLYITNVMEK
jgi:hypothetical protein